MATEKNITMKQYNGTDYDTLYPETTIEQVENLSNQFLLSNVTYYVSASGSDTTGDGTSANPFATVNYAVRLIPKNLNKYRVVINIVGNLTQTISCSNFFGGRFEIVGDGTTEITGDCTFERCSKILFRKIAKVIGSVYFDECPVATIDASNNDLTLDGNAGSYCLFASSGTKLTVSGTTSSSITFQNATFGIICTETSQVSITGSTTASGSTAEISSTISKGLVCEQGSLICFYGYNNASTARYLKNAIILQNGTVYP